MSQINKKIITSPTRALTNLSFNIENEAIVVSFSCLSEENY